MSILSNVYCLGCKTRHPQVKIDEVIEMTVKGSIRYQGKGVCENGKTWCKILKPDEIPASYLNKTPNEEVDSITVFEKGVELSSQEPVVEEPVVDVPVVEEPVVEVPVVEEPVVEVPVVEEPVVEVPVVEEPVDVPQPLSPADIESFDTPIVPETYEAPQTYYDGTNGLEEQEEETGRVESERPIKPLRLRRTRPFVPQRREPFVDRRMVETEPKPAPIRRINQQDDIEKAKKVGDFMGKSMFNSVGDEYPKYLRANWERTKIPLEHFEHFEAAYLSAGAIKSSEVKAEDGQMDAKTVAGIAGIGILAAWFASQLNNRDSP
tara:strand:- start:7586 stop:8548 length:963 start_codon:yes stop_codon:yes gene_type:complete